MKVASSLWKSRSKRYVCCLESYIFPRRSASSLVIISPTYSTTNLFFGINSRVFNPHPRPSAVRNIQTCFYNEKKEKLNIWGILWTLKLKHLRDSFTRELISLRNELIYFRVILTTPINKIWVLFRSARLSRIHFQ